MIFNLYSGVIV